MRRTRTIVVVALSPFLSSCSGTMNVEPCLINGRVAFELEDVPRLFFGKEEPTPHRLAVFTKGNEPWEKRVLWEIEPIPRKRSLIVYGQNIAGSRVPRRAKPLRVGERYMVHVAAGPFVGSAEFVVSNDLRACQLDR